jgi:hypothetical protein
MRLVVVALALIGCKSDAVPADCSTVANGVKTYWSERAAVTTDADEREAIVTTSREAAETMERHCRADHWSDEMIACARAVFRLDDSGCMKFLSPLQKAKLDQEAPPVPGGIGIGIGH